MNGRFFYPSTVKLLFALLLIMGLQACNSSNAQTAQIKRITNDELKELLSNSSVQLVDVRTPQEYNQGHIGDAQLIDFMRPDFKEKVSKLDKDQPIVVYCAVGGRSYQSTEVLKSLGFKEIYDLKRGIAGWAQAGLPTKK